jgi:hypothetical protein
VINGTVAYPSSLSLSTQTYAPTVQAGVELIVTPGTKALTLTTFAPRVSRSVQDRNYYIDSNGNIYWVINQDIGLVERV